MNIFKNTRICLLFLLLIVQISWAVELNGVEVPKERLIFYFFIGHSNMMGYGGQMDTVSHPRVWMYSVKKGFWNAHDPIETNRQSPSPALPFLKKMAEYYPDYYFCGVKMTQAGQPMANDFFRGKPKYQILLETVDSLKNKATLGGVLAMFGLVEGISDSLSARLCEDVIIMFSSFREDFGIPDLPCIFGRFEENADTTVIPDYFTYKERIIAQIEAIPDADPLHRTALTPYEAVPKEMYFGDHHYNEDGYALWSNTAAEIIKSKGWDYWKTDNDSPLYLLYPWGGETFNLDDIIPVIWTYNPDSLSLILINISLDSGKTWELISGDTALPAELDTFYWNPSESSLDLIGKDIILRVINSGGNYSDTSKFFSIVIPNPAPEFTSIPVLNATVNKLYTYNITTSYADTGALLTIAATTLPLWLALTDNSDGTATLSGIPDTSDLGDHEIVLTVTDGIISQPVVQSFTISTSYDSTLSLKYPCGGETFNIENTIPVIWTYNPDSLSFILTHISLDSGKTWELISGDVALPAESNTFYWNPSKNGLDVIGKDIILRIINYNGNYREKSKFFSIDTTNALLEFTSTPVLNAIVNTLYAYHITTSDANTGTILTITATNLPSWLMLTDNGDGTGTLSGIPGSGNIGDYEIVLTVTDEITTQSVEQSFTLSVVFKIAITKGNQGNNKLKALTLNTVPNPVTNKSDVITFSYNTPDIAEARLKVYDAVGNLVYNTEFSPADKVIAKWDLNNSFGKKVANGTYLAVLWLIYNDGTIEQLKTIIGIKRD